MRSSDSDSKNGDCIPRILMYGSGELMQILVTETIVSCFILIHELTEFIVLMMYLKVHQQM